MVGSQRNLIVLSVTTQDLRWTPFEYRVALVGSREESHSRMKIYILFFEKKKKNVEKRDGRRLPDISKRCQLLLALFFSTWKFFFSSLSSHGSSIFLTFFSTSSVGLLHFTSLHFASLHFLSFSLKTRGIVYIGVSLQQLAFIISIIKMRCTITRQKPRMTIKAILNCIIKPWYSSSKS